MGFSLALPPLVVLLLLAFLWLVLLVLLLWFAFGPRRNATELKDVDKEPQTRVRRDGLEATLKTEAPKTRPPQPSPPRTTVRAVSPAERSSNSEPDSHDDFDDFNRPNNRRDDFDF